MDKLTIPKATLSKADLLSMLMQGGGTPAFTPRGIGIMLANGRIMDYNNPNLWTYTREQIIGITITDENISVIINPDAPQKAYFCHGRSVCPNAQKEPGIHAAGAKYIGQEATSNLRQCLTGDQGWAVNKAYNTMLNGQHCYLPYQGELRIIFENKATINELLLKCGCPALPEGDYWSSAILERVDVNGENTDDASGYLHFVAGINFGNNNIWGLNVQGLYYVLPITRLKN